MLDKKAILIREKIKRNIFVKKAALAREKNERNMLDKEAVLIREKLKKIQWKKQFFLKQLLGQLFFDSY